MKPDPATTGKLLVHGTRTGPVSDEAIEQRAHELAMIRSSGRGVTVADREAARAELLGGSVPPAAAEAEGTAGATRDPSDAVGDPGHAAETVETSDENAVPERLVLEGVEEAQHEQMLEARRARSGEH